MSAIRAVLRFLTGAFGGDGWLDGRSRQVGGALAFIGNATHAGGGFAFVFARNRGIGHEGNMESTGDL